MFLIEGRLHETLLQLTQDEFPREVGGLIVDGQHVHVLENHSDDNSSFEFHLVELRRAIELHGMTGGPGSEIAERVVLWHSHPGGGVGPSREDMQNRTPLKYHLVLAYVDGDLVSTWY